MLRVDGGTIDPGAGSSKRTSASSIGQIVTG